MRLHEARDLLARVTYKQGWKFSLRTSKDDFQAFLIVSSKEKDATGVQPDLIDVTLHEPLPPLDFINSHEEFLILVRRAIHRKELHEADEWLKVDGRAPYYPHR